MTMSYKFTDREVEESLRCRETLPDRKALRRLNVLQPRTEGRCTWEISWITGYHTPYITLLVSRYKKYCLFRII